MARNSNKERSSSARISRVTRASGDAHACEEAADIVDSYDSDQEYYDAAPAHYLMWGAAHREKALCKGIFDKALRRYPCTDPRIQALAGRIASADPAALVKISVSLRAERSGLHGRFVTAALFYCDWLRGKKDSSLAFPATAAFVEHVGDAREFGNWLRTELTFEIWSRNLGAED